MAQYLRWLAHLVSRFTCNTKVMRFESTGFPSQVAVTKKLESNYHVNKQKLNVKWSINQIVIGQSHKSLVNTNDAIKICDSHLTCKVANKCLNVRERVEVVERNKRRPPPFPCWPVSRQCSWKKNLIEKQNSVRIFKFSPFLYTIKSCQWNFINFSKFVNVLIRKEIKHLRSSQWEKKNWEKLDCYITGCFIKSFNMAINHFFVLQAHLLPNFCFLISG